MLIEIIKEYNDGRRTLRKGRQVSVTNELGRELISKRVAKNANDQKEVFEKIIKDKFKKAEEKAEE